MENVRGRKTAAKSASATAGLNSSKDKNMAEQTETKILSMDELQAMMDKSSKSAATAVLSDFDSKIKNAFAAYKVDNGPVKSAEVISAKETPKAELSDAGVANFQVMGIPIGQAVAGGFVAVFATELVDGFLAKQNSYVRGAVKLGAAYAAVKWGKKIPFVGETGAKAIALLIAFDAVRDFIPIDTYAKNLATKISGTWTSAGLAQGSSYSYKKVSAPVTPAGDYYSRMAG